MPRFNWSALPLAALLLAAPSCAVGAGAAAAPAPAPRYGEAEVARLLEIAETEKEPEGLRARAVRELRHTALRTHMGALRRLLREERSLDIRLSAAVTLAALGDRQAPRDLLLVSAYDGTTTPNCSRSDVISALAELRDPAAELHLERALREPLPEDDSQFHAQVCRALALLDSPGAHRVLLTALRDGSASARHAAITPLARLASTPRHPVRRPARDAILRTARTDGDEQVAEQAASALFWGGVDGPAFFQLLESDPDPAVRARAARVMDRHYLTPARLERLRAAAAREQHPETRAVMERVLASQNRQ